MKTIITLFAFLCATVLVRAQGVNVLYNDGLASYIDNSQGGNYVISFECDTMIRQEHGYLADSSFYQIIKFEIGDDKAGNVYSEEGERRLLDSFKNYEKDYSEQNYIKGPLNIVSEYFRNDNGKQFLLWYYELPFAIRGKSRLDQSGKGQIKAIRYQANLMFTTKKQVVMVCLSIYDTDSLQKGLDMLKQKIANSVRVYAGQVNIAVLNNQLRYKIEGKPFVIDLPDEGIKMKIPFWLNVLEGKYDVVASFPDINNVANAMVLMMIDKSEAPTLKEFCKGVLESNPNFDATLISKDPDKLVTYKVLAKTTTDVYHCSFVFFETKTKYAWLNFTATEETYPRNIGKFKEFLSGIELK